MEESSPKNAEVAINSATRLSNAAPWRTQLEDNSECIGGIAALGALGGRKSTSPEKRERGESFRAMNEGEKPYKHRQIKALDMHEDGQL